MILSFWPINPCNEVSGVTPDAVPMPDLSEQSGSLENIGDKDFLVGRVVASYADNNGTVSFSGDNSLEHVYSLLYLSVVGDDLIESAYHNRMYIYRQRNSNSPYLFV